MPNESTIQRWDTGVFEKTLISLNRQVRLNPPGLNLQL